MSKILKMNMLWGGVIRRHLKESNLVYFLRYKLMDKDYKTNLKKMKLSTLKSKSQIQEEMRRVADYWNCDPAHYVRYGLYNRNLSEVELLDYIPAYHFYNFYLEPHLVGVDRRVFDDKLQLYYLFRKYGINTPTVLAVVKNCKLCDIVNMNANPNLLNQLLENGGKLFFKPVNGQGGTGIKVYKKDRDGELDVFIAQLNSDTLYVVQEGIKQREDIAVINSSSVNTLRVITQNINGEPHICACVMRVGRNGKEVDNSHQGGMSVEIDITTGAFHSTATAEHGGGIYTSHPDSKFEFDGKSVVGWDEIKSTVLSYANKFPQLKEIGWDIALAHNGVQAIELNLNFGLDHLQVICGGMRRRLGVFPAKK